MARLFRTRRGSSRSIARLIFTAFIAMGLLTGAVGLYGLWVLSEAGRVVADTYDRALMAVSYARSASLDFSRMEFEMLRRVTAPAAEQAAITAALDRLNTSLMEDLRVVEERSLASDEQETIRHIRELAARWGALRDAGASGERERDIVARQLIDRLDMLVELTSDHSFVARRKALTQVQLFTYGSFGAITFALLLSALVTLFLTRRIMGPLAAAAAVADRIANGELETPIPAGGKDETGLLLHSMTVMQDNIRMMVEREQAQRRSAQSRLAEALESSVEAIVLVDTDGRIVISNSQLAAFFPIIAPQLGPGMNFGDAFRHLRQLVSGDNSAGDQLAPDLLADGSEFRLTDGRWLKISRSATAEGGFFLIISDIGDLKEREARLEQALLDAEAASEAKSAFLAAVSHELRTPLNAIIGFSEVLSAEMFGALGNPKYVDYAENIQQSGRNLLGLINNVLDLTRHQGGTLELVRGDVDLAKIVDDCVKDAREPCAQAALTLAVEAPENLMIDGDSGRLTQVLGNLLSNAIKFTSPGGSITVRAEALESAAKLQVSDTGIGMSADEIPIALAAFGQVDARLARRYEGSGLGLPLAKSLVELHGGRLEIDSVMGKGTTVTILLPYRPAAVGNGHRLHLVA